MQRHENETFDAYKERRAAANMAVKRLNWDSKGGTQSSRSKLREQQKLNGKKLGGYGETVRFSLNERIPVSPSVRRANQKAFARRIANSAPSVKVVSARQERIHRKALMRAQKATLAQS